MAVENDWRRNKHKRKDLWWIMTREREILERTGDRWIVGNGGNTMRSGMRSYRQLKKVRQTERMEKQ
jgi:hypothetical protein